MGIAVTIALAIAAGIGFLAFQKERAFKRLVEATAVAFGVAIVAGFGVMLGGHLAGVGYDGLQIVNIGGLISGAGCALFAYVLFINWLRKDRGDGSDG